MSIFTKGNWENRNVQYPKRRRLTEVEGQPNIYDVDREEGTIVSEGSAFSAENMNGLENRIETAFDNLISKIKEAVNGVVLFIGGEGGQAQGVVTLYDSVANYDYIEIYFRSDDNAFDCVKVFNPNGKKTILSVVRKRYNPKDTYPHKIWLKTTEYAINDNKLTPNKISDIPYYGNFSFDSGKTFGYDTTQYIHIHKVIGYKNNIF